MDALLALKTQRQEREAAKAADTRDDPLDMLRKIMVSDLIPTFAELVDKYAPMGVSMRMDASKLLAGGREVTFDFAVGDDRSTLVGTVTSEAIAFHETRYVAGTSGGLTSGPMLRLRQLDRSTFRAFVCERLATLMRSALRKT